MRMFAVPANKARFQPVSAKQPSRRRAEAIMARRKELVAEVTRLRNEENNATFADKAMQLLTRWWASTGWNAREELLKSADWLIRVERQNQQAKSAS